MQHPHTSLSTLHRISRVGGTSLRSAVRREVSDERIVHSRENRARRKRLRIHFSLNIYERQTLSMNNSCRIHQNSYSSMITIIRLSTGRTQEPRHRPPPAASCQTCRLAASPSQPRCRRQSSSSSTPPTASCSSRPGGYGTRLPWDSRYHLHHLHSHDGSSVCRCRLCGRRARDGHPQLGTHSSRCRSHHGKTALLE